MKLEKLLEAIYKAYKSDLETEDNPPTRPELSYELGNIVELRGNVHIYLWQKTENGYLGLLATPYTLLAHPTHPRVETEGLLYETFAITDLRIPLTSEIIRKYLTDVIRVKTNKEILERKIEQSFRRKKVYHPIREKFIRDEARRTAFLIEEYLREVGE